METNVSDERLRFVTDYESGHWSMTELCERYRVTRPTGYKWLARHRAGGRARLVDRSRAPHTCPHRTSDITAALIVAARQKYGWGAKKLLRILRNQHPRQPWPARSTVNDVLVRRVSTAGTFRLRGQQPFLSQALCGEDYSTLLGKIDERRLQITGST